MTTTQYTAWYEVPAHLRTRTQLAALDLPRIPAGPVRATVYAHGGTSRKSTFELYDIHESAPSPTSAKTLAAAAARRDPATHQCQDCGARTDTPTTAHYLPHGTDRETLYLCWSCLHIHRLRDAQARLAAQLPDLAARAHAWLTADSAAVLSITTLTPPPTDSGRPRPPVAATIDAVTPSGAPLLALTVRLRATRQFPTLIPTDALDLDTATPQVLTALAGRQLISWQPDDLKAIASTLPPVSDRPSEQPTYQFGSRIADLSAMVAAWRGELNPTTRTTLHPHHPGRADRMALLIQRIATHHTDQTTP
jgi:hypothetical protein